MCAAENIILHHLAINKYPTSNFCFLHFDFQLLLFVERQSGETIRRDTFDGSRKDINAAIDQICEFTGE